MKKIWQKFQQWWYFHLANPVVREGKSEAFSWRFRRFWLDVSTASGNWKARWTASEHPYAYLLVGKSDENIIGFCQFMYSLSMLLTKDQGLVDDVAKAIKKYEKRVDKQAAGEVVEDETQEKIALEEVKAVQEVVEMPKKERRKYERDVNGRFKKAVKEVEKNG